MSNGKQNSAAAPAVENLDAQKRTIRYLYLIVPLAGAVSMGVQMCGARMLEPYFGTGIYVWGAVIGVFMFALSLGYFLGGRLADRFPTFNSLGLIILIAAVLTMLVNSVASHICPFLNESFQVEVRYRTLLACLALFAPPTALLGMVSPFAIKLAARQVADLGRITGSLYAVSTLGSIISTFLLTFLLVEFMGVASTMYAVGIVTLLIALYCFYLGMRKPETPADNPVGHGDVKPAKQSTAAAAAGVSDIGVGTLYLVVFLSGTALMALEMAGARLVEPHFGSTIYVWGSIIGVFMLALSLGYWGGGRLTDRSPRIETLGLVMLVGSLLVLAIPPFAPGLSAWMNEFTGIDVRYRTLIACLFLFALPSICMGMVSPFGVRLAASKVSALGSVAGSLYAVSTLGSIVGTLLVSFILVEYIGTSYIIYGVGIILGLVAVFCMFRGAGAFRKVGAGIACVAIIAGYFGARTPLTQVHAGEELLEVKESAYHYITIINGRSQIHPYRLPARLMMFNNLIESGIILDEKTKNLLPPPARTACGYVDLLHLGMVFTGHAPKDMLVIGCGGGVGPRMFKENYPDEVKLIDVVDIDPWVFKLAEKWFNYPFTSDSVIKSHVLDGRMYVEQEEKGKRWDYIIMDAYSSGGRIPKHLITEEFFTTIRDRLTDDGVMLINVISSFEKPRSGLDHSRLFRSVYKTIEKVYGADRPEQGSLYAFPRNRSGQGENIIIVATKKDIPRYSGREIERRYRIIKNRYLSHTDLDAVVQRMLLNRPETDDVPLLTDDFCPTDSMVHR